MKRNINLTNILLSLIAIFLYLIVVKLYSPENVTIGKAAVAHNSPSAIVLDDSNSIKLDDSIPIRVQIYGGGDYSENAVAVDKFGHLSIKQQF